ncbi:MULTISPECIES: hypothetical protein [unclassified Chelatococcus]|uniref:hypothetical protein n=1 Tax=unclassified Chelatococcus TaxID=2638111 RepID=UPI001BCDD161|nr:MULTISPECIES: hypothetical protein [unclassified Chelatococcus]MBS7700542.1 hypothetical protein [Chelatococcus sp. YT9]MBX3558657.1 hypothetical protein [Chelatococcus sp.]
MGTQMLVSAEQAVDAGYAEGASLHAAGANQTRIEFEVERCGAAYPRGAALRRFWEFGFRHGYLGRSPPPSKGCNWPA